MIWIYYWLERYNPIIKEQAIKIKKDKQKKNKSELDIIEKPLKENEDIFIGLILVGILNKIN